MMPVLVEVFAKWRQKENPFRNLCLDIKPGLKGVQEKKKGVMIMINYHSDSDVFLADRNTDLEAGCALVEPFVPQTWFLSEVENQGQDIRKTARKKAGKEL